MAFGQRSAEGTFEEIDDGSVLTLVRPTQGGQVIFVGGRVTNLPCDDLEVRARIRDPRTRNYLAEDRRTHIDLVPSEDGTVGDFVWDRISDPANVPVCPNWVVDGAMEGPEFELDLRIGPKGGPYAEGRITVTMACQTEGLDANGEPVNPALCHCECAEDYEFGKCEG